MGQPGVVRARRIRHVPVGLPPRTRHSRNIAERPEVALVVFDSAVPISTGQGVYVEAVEVVPERRRGAADRVFSRRSLAQFGGREWTAATCAARRAADVPRRRHVALGARPRHAARPRRPPGRRAPVGRGAVVASDPGCEHMFVAGAGDDPPRRPRRLLRVGRAARRPAPARPAVIVGGGVVLAASYEAKAYGVRDRDGRRQALRLCPHAIVVPPRIDGVHRGQPRRVRGLRGHDAAGRGPLDRRGVPRRARPATGSPARPSRSPCGCVAHVRERVGLPITVGVARTKFLAKVASGVAKPDGLLVVPPDGELDFLHPLPVERLWGVGAKTAERCTHRGVRTVADVAALSEGALVCDARARRRAPAPRARPQPRPAAGRRRQAPRLDRAPSARSAADRTAPRRSTPRWSASSTASRARMRRADRVGRTVMLRLRFDDFTRATRSPHAAAGDGLDARRPRHGARAPGRRGAADRGARAHARRRRRRQPRARDAAASCALPLRPPRGALDTALDEVRDRYGSTAVTRAVLLGRDPGWMVPLLPD